MFIRAASGGARTTSVYALIRIVESDGLDFTLAPPCRASPMRPISHNSEPISATCRHAAIGSGCALRVNK
jgi:hypothetical protein